MNRGGVKYVLFGVLLFLLSQHVYAEEWVDIMVHEDNAFVEDANYEASVSDSTGTLIQGTFRECWDYVSSTNTSHVITLASDVTVVGETFSNGTNHEGITVDLNGHTFTAAGDEQPTLFTLTKVTFKLTDSTPIVETTEYVNTKIDWYCDESLVWCTGDPGTLGIVKHSIDMSTVGKFSATGIWNCFDLVSGATLRVDNCLITAPNCRLCKTSDWGLLKVTNSYLYGVGESNVEGPIAVMTGGSITVTDSTFIGCMSSNGGLFHGWVPYNISGTLSDCYSSNQGLIWTHWKETNLHDLNISYCRARNGSILVLDDQTSVVDVLLYGCESPDRIVNALRNCADTFESVRFVKNKCTRDGNLFDAGDNTSLINVRFINNTSTNTILRTAGTADVSYDGLEFAGNMSTNATMATAEGMSYSNITMRDNHAPTAFAIQHNVSLSGKFDIDNAKLYDGVILSTTDAFDPTSNIRIYTDELNPDLPVCNLTAEEQANAFTPALNFVYKIVQDNILYFTKQNPDQLVLRDDCVTVQYYVYLPRVQYTSETGSPIPLYDTRVVYFPVICMLIL